MRNLILAALTVVITTGCSLVLEPRRPVDSDGDVDVDSDIDGDVDGDGDSDTDTDGDGDGDSDSDGEACDYYPDRDEDGFGDAEAEPTQSPCGGKGGFVENNLDCNDSDPDINPDAEERCNGLDDDCDDVVPDDEVDSDGDNYAACEGDCDDTDSRFYPGAREDDCTDPNDYNCDGSTGYADNDSDDWPACEDCNDSDPDVNPEAEEICDGVDNNCDSEIDEGFDDFDDDGQADCVDEDDDNDFDPDETDCEPLNPDVSSLEEEVCDGVDNNCDDEVDEGFDEDEDGFTTCEDDCDDGNPDAYPGAEELCDGVDNDCSGEVSEDEVDDDSDGLSECEGDCDDTDPMVNSSMFEVRDGVDNDCDGDTDEEEDTAVFYLPLNSSPEVVPEGRVIHNLNRSEFAFVNGGVDFRSEEGIDGAYHFDGTGEILFPVADPSRGLADQTAALDELTLAGRWTYMAWVRPDELERTKYVFHHYDDCPGGRVASGYSEFAARHDPSDGETSYCRGEELSVGEWSHIAITWDGERVRGFLNGELTCEFVRHSVPVAGALRLGNDGGTTPRKWVGLIDEFFVLPYVAEEGDLRDYVHATERFLP